MMWAICLVWLAAVIVLAMHWWRWRSRALDSIASEQSIRQYLRQQRYRIDP